MKSTEKNPWQLLTTSTVYDNNWITVCHEEVINPSGGEGIYGRVHFKNLAIGVIPIDDEGNTYLVGQYRYPLKAYSWEIPEGGCPLDEDPIEAAKRELLEETGLVASEIIKIADVHLSNSVSDEFGYVYMAKNLTMTQQQLEDTEQIMVLKLPLKAAIEMAMDGRITDSLSIIGLLKISKFAILDAIC